MRKSVKRRLSVLAGAVALCVLVGAVIALPASAHIVTGVDASCDEVIVHFKYFPDNPVPVTFKVNVGLAPTITKIVGVSTTQDVTIDISNETASLNGGTANVVVDMTWTLFGSNHVTETRSVTCGTEPTTTSSTSTSTSTSSTSTSTSTSTTKPATTTTRPATTTTRSSTTTTTTTTTPPATGGRGNIFQVELRRCTQVHEGYNHFPAGTVVRWKVYEDGAKVAAGQFAAIGGSNYHFITQFLGARLQASPHKADVHYYWIIGGMAYSYFVRRAPGCSGTSRIGVSGPGNMFVVTVRDCRVLHVGYSYFPAGVPVLWVVGQYPHRVGGIFVTQPGNQYHFLNRALGTTLRPSSKAAIAFYWRIGLTHYHYLISRSSGC